MEDPRRLARKSAIEPLEGVRLQSFLSNEVRLSNTYNDEVLSAKRRESWDTYYGRPYGNEIEGRSAVVTTEVQDYVETLMGDLVEVFLEQKGPWTFQPTKMMAADACEDANNLIDYTLHTLNPGWELIHDTLKAAVLQDVGYLKTTWWDGEPDQSRVIRGQSGIDVIKLSMQQQYRITEVMDAENGAPVDAGQFTLEGVYDVEVEWDVPAYPKVWGCPYEEVLHTPNITSFQEDVPFIAHRYSVTRTELLQRGFDPDIVEQLPTFTDIDLSKDRQKRFQPQQMRVRRQTADPSVETVQMYECYVYADFQGTGRAEYGLVNAGGSGGQLKIFADTETGAEYTPINDHPFIAVSAIRLPYKHPGRGFGELLFQTQKEKSAQRRNVNDNIYYSTNGRHAINERVEPDSYLRNVVGMPVVVSGKEPVSGSIESLRTESIIHQTIPYLEYLDREAERKTGVKLSGELLAPEMMNSTFGGINLLMGAAKKRTLYVARTIAESMKLLPLKILNLYIENQNEPLDVPVGSDWKQIDTRTWPLNATVQVNFGFANGTQAQRVAMYDRIRQEQKELVQLQGGFEGPFVNADDYSRMLHEWTEALGLEASDLAFNDEEDVKGQYQKQMQNKAQAEQKALGQDPAAMMFQLESTKVQAKSQADMMKIQMDERNKRYELELADQREREKIGLGHRADIMNVELDHQVDMYKAELGGQTDIYKADLDDDTEQTRVALDSRRKAQGDFITQAAKGPVQ